ncbi:MAG: class I SAM-dependent methyltransferase [Rhodospirillales bacterium]|nr:class I SAM-dependent methyltransferase [Alphaproteobacteria bacterium]MCB9986543.1 class I SAM-dependent methyltransferase [Rhodospirillales bacterium]USO06921.1 MAG: class I SAM-dependent methyltransferase [Rhodospirillales bacterium]
MHPITDTLTAALLYAAEQSGDLKSPVAIVNAADGNMAGMDILGVKGDACVKQSDNACNNLKNTLECVFNSVFIRATRQIEETLGYLVLAADHTAPDGHILIAQENAHGAQGLEKTVRRVFPNARAVIKYKCRTLVLARADADPAALERWRAAASIRFVAAGKGRGGGFWTTPGLFAWDRADPGSRLLLETLPLNIGSAIADLGCGNGYLAMHLARRPELRRLYAIDADARAVECCRRNLATVAPPTLEWDVRWGDATRPAPDLTGFDAAGFDAVVTNPPFHTQQDEDRALGQRFCVSAINLLKPGGSVYLVANRHLPYETVLENAGGRITLLADTLGYKVLQATKGD